MYASLRREKILFQITRVHFRPLRYSQLKTPRFTHDLYILLNQSTSPPNIYMRGGCKPRGLVEFRLLFSRSLSGSWDWLPAVFSGLHSTQAIWTLRRARQSPCAPHSAFVSSQLGATSIHRSLPSGQPRSTDVRDDGNNQHRDATRHAQALTQSDYHLGGDEAFGPRSRRVSKVT